MITHTVNSQNKFLSQTKQDEIQFCQGQKIRGYSKCKRKSSALFQGNRRTSDYFEGWYFKMVDNTNNNVLSVIPGISLSEDGSEQFSFIQLIDGKTAETYYLQYPIDSFYYSRDEFKIRIGSNIFCRDSIQLNISRDTFQAKGVVHYTNSTILSNKEKIMGWYGKVPFLECYHGVVSLDHAVNGQLQLNDKKFTFANGDGYIEKDWGESMPSSWIWLQTNSFKKNGNSFMLSIANIPWRNKSFTGFLGFSLINGQREIFGTYSKAELRFEQVENGLIIRIKTKKKLYVVEAFNSNTGLLAAPVNGSMDRRIAESVDASVVLTIYDTKGNQIYKDESNTAGLELVGDISELKNFK